LQAAAAAAVAVLPSRWAGQTEAAWRTATEMTPQRDSLGFNAFNILQAAAAAAVVNVGTESQGRDEEGEDGQEGEEGGDGDWDGAAGSNGLAELPAHVALQVLQRLVPTYHNAPVHTSTSSSPNIRLVTKYPRPSPHTCHLPLLATSHIPPTPLMPSPPPPLPLLLAPDGVRT